VKGKGKGKREKGKKEKEKERRREGEKEKGQATEAVASRSRSYQWLSPAEQSIFLLGKISRYSSACNISPWNIDFRSAFTT